MLFQNTVKIQNMRGRHDGNVRARIMDIVALYSYVHEVTLGGEID